MSPDLVFSAAKFRRIVLIGPVFAEISDVPIFPVSKMNTQSYIESSLVQECGGKI